MFRGCSRSFIRFAKFFFFPPGINRHGIRWPYAARRLWCTGYLPYGKPADYLDILKGVEKQSGGTKWNKYPGKSVSGSNHSQEWPQLLVGIYTGNIIKLREHPKAIATKFFSEEKNGWELNSGMVKMQSMLQWAIRSQAAKLLEEIQPPCSSETKW